MAWISWRQRAEHHICVKGKKQEEISHRANIPEAAGGEMFDSG